MLALREPGARRRDRRAMASCSRSAAASRCACWRERVVNSAGLDAPALAARFTGRDRRAACPGPTTARATTTASPPARPSATADLPRPGARRPGRARHRRPRRPLPLRPGHRMGRRDPLPGRPGAGRRLLRRGPQILARPARRRAGAGLFRHPAEARRPPARPAADFVRVRPGRARRAGPGRAVRDREPGPHRLLADRLRGGAGWVWRSWRTSSA